MMDLDSDGRVELDPDKPGSVLGDLEALQGVRNYPVRIKCANLAVDHAPGGALRRLRGTVPAEVTMSVQVHVSRPHEGVAQLLVDNGPGNFSTAALHERSKRRSRKSALAGTRVVVLGSHLDGVFISHGHIGDIVASSPDAASQRGSSRHAPGAEGTRHRDRWCRSPRSTDRRGVAGFSWPWPATCGLPRTLFVDKFAERETVERLLGVQRRYDEGADSYEAFGIPPP
jgi:hypothetical protein